MAQVLMGDGFMIPEDLTTILAKHRKWINNGFVGIRADLNGADLSGADLSRADLRCANLSGADLSGADLSRANLSRANLSGANLNGADLSRADLRWTNLSGADLNGADLNGADLSGAVLNGADLSGADLDFSTGFSFKCSSFGAKIDIRLGAQMVYHFCRMETDDPEVQKAQYALRNLANMFHRVNECGRIP